MAEQLMLLDKQLAALGFVEPEPSDDRRIVMSTASKEKKGKTHWAMTAPGAIAAVSADAGTREVVEKFRARGKKIVLCEIAAPPLVGLLKKDTVTKDWIKEKAEEAWEKAKRAIVAIIESTKFRTLVVDTASEMWELCRLAYFGKLDHVRPQHYVEVNSEFRQLVKRAKERRDLNSIWIHKVKKEWKEKPGSDQANWTGRYETAGFGDMAFLVDLNAQNYFNEEERTFGLRVEDCPRQNWEIVGQEFEGEMCNFATLATCVFPDSSPGDWE